MTLKMVILLSMLCFSLPAQDYPDTSDVPDTSTQPDTSECPDTSGYPDTSEYQDTSDYPDNSGYPENSSYPDNSDYPEMSGYQQNVEYSDTTGYGDTLNGDLSGADDGADGRYNAPSNAYMGVGIGAAFNLSADNPTYQAFIGKMWGLGKYAAFNMLAEGATDFDDSWFVDGVLRLDFYPLPTYTVISPYIGFGAGIGWATISDDEDALGVNLTGTLGLRLFKDLPLGFIFEASADWLLSDVVDGNPVIVTGRVGIAF